MKRFLRMFFGTACAVGALMGSAELRPAMAGNFSSQFDAGLPAGATLFNSASIQPTLGIGGSGAVELTPNINSASGHLLIAPLDALPVLGLTASFAVSMRDQTCCGEVGPNGPADGLSLSFSNVIPAVPAYGDPGEEGLPTGLSINLDTYDNGGGEAPAIDVKWNGVVVAFAPVFTYTGGRYADVSINLDQDGTIDVSFDSVPVISNAPTGYLPITGGQFIFGARTGGANSRHLIDDLSITTSTVPEPGAMMLMATLGAALVPWTIRRYRRKVA